MSTPAPAQVTINPYAQYEPDPKLSPGDVNPDLTAAVLSSPGFTTKKYRNVPQSVKDQVYAEYNITSHKPGDYEVDHIISLELGGSNDIKNLWPQPYHGLWN
ncbi:HNH endonuclease signature motif containing protein, partial [Streptomyces brasiliscabiei]